MNGATEQTLSELLAVAQASNVNMVKLLKIAEEIKKNTANMGTGGGIAGAAGGASAALSGLAKSAGPLAVAMNLITVAGDTVAKLFSGLGSIIGHTIGIVTNVGGALVDFSIKAAEGTAKLSDLYAAFKDLPLGLGMVASIFSKIVAYSEKLLGTYQKLTNAGASFSGDLLAMRNSAARAQLNMEQFADVINKNSEFFSTMGGSVQSGIDKFVLASGELMGPASPYAKSILSLGVSAEEASGYLVSMMKSQGMMNKAGAADASKLAEYTASYITELDTLSKVTGKRKEQIDAEVQKAEADDAWQLFMDSLTPDESAKAKSMLAIAETYNGKAGVEQMKASLRGLDTPVGKLATNLAVASGGISLNGESVRKALHDQSIGIEGASKITTDSQLKTASAVGKLQKDIGTVGQAAGVGAEYMNSASIATSRKLEAAGGDAQKMFKKAEEDRVKQLGGSAAQLALAQQNIKNFGNVITEVMTRLLGPISGSLITFGTSVIDAINIFIRSKEFQKAVDDVTTWFKTAFGELKVAYGAGGFSAAFKLVIEKMVEGVQNIWDKVWPVIKPTVETVFTKLTDVLAPMFKKLFEGMLNMISDFIGDKYGIGEGSKDRKDREAAEQSEDYKKWAASDKATKRSLGLTGMYDRSPKEMYEQYQAQIELGQHKQLDNSGRATAASDPRIAQPRATGGPISPGTYLVGEKGPEVITTKASGDVVNNDNLTALMAKASQDINLAGSIERLNTLTAQVLAAMKENNDYTRRNLEATKSLSGNLFS